MASKDMVLETSTSRKPRLNIVEFLCAADYTAAKADATTDSDINVGDVLFWADGRLEKQVINGGVRTSDYVVAAQFVEILSENLVEVAVNGKLEEKVESFTFQNWNLDCSSGTLKKGNQETRPAAKVFERCVDAGVILDAIYTKKGTPIPIGIAEILKVQELFEVAVESAQDFDTVEELI